MEDNNQNRESVIQEVHEHLPRRWPLLVLYAVLALVVAAIVVSDIVRWIGNYHIALLPDSWQYLPRIAVIDGDARMFIIWLHLVSKGVMYINPKL